MFVVMDLEGRITYVNGAARSLLGYEPEELLGRTGGELIAPVIVDDAIEVFTRARGGDAQVGKRTLARRKDGSHVQIRFDASPVHREDDGAVVAVSLTAYEVEERPPARRAPQAASHRDEEAEVDLIGRLPAVVYVAEPGADGTWHYISAQIEALLGYTQAEWCEQPHLWAERLHPDDRDRVLDEEEHDAVHGAPLASEYRMVTKDGDVVWVRDEAVMRSGPAETRIYDGLLIDITERKRFESELQYLAEHDSLTGLRNRRTFLAELDAELRRKRRFDQPTSVLMIDVDHLKHVNDTRGHQAGDALLLAVAGVLEGRLRESDSVARLGGDEFGVLLRGADHEAAMTVARELVERIAHHARAITGDAGAAGASVGVAELHRRFESAEQALAAADAAMYEAKRGGGGAAAEAAG